MKNFMARIWDGKNQQMIYPSESFYWTLSLGGEVFMGNKVQEDCDVMPFSGVCDIEGNEIYEGDIIIADYGDEYEEKKGRSTVIYKDGDFHFIMGGYERIEWTVCKQIVKDFKIKVVDNIYEKAQRKVQK